ncbi:PREDICTED: activating signal cointegrator 1 complex subunit 1-like [Ceratosolen solmsi marchali]|uniref:Activating signal cointegrator 1 complex subunit 1-like n=1 Tax=Ceratosolen solmsi marchali TaxID=326594 RepID=A0AAJ6YK33_9HYME|nr:PREDICTED: activating signal cointegrator 1 complex subunit 1-like [Ceratosolen solmsi marchali]
MDISNPTLAWIENRCYRVCDNTYVTDNDEIAPYTEEVYDPYELNNLEFEDESIEITPYKGSLYKHSFQVNSNLYGMIIGAKGATLKRIKLSTNTKINVPKLGQEGSIVIIGENKKNIITARYQINCIIENARSKMQPTHFLGIPTNSENIVDQFTKFKDNILNNYANDEGIVENIFQIPNKLHVTIVTLILLDEIERKKAIDVFEACHKDVIKPFLDKSGPITIVFKGLKCMNQNSSKARVLYCSIHNEEGYLQELLDKIAEYFIDQGVATTKFNKVKMHMTLMNVRYIHLRSQESNDKTILSFDATNILKNHEDTYLGQINLSTIHLSQIHTKTEGGYYKATAEINLINS